MVDLGFVEGLFRVRLFWCSFKVFRFVEVLVDGLKHCKFRRISLRHAPKNDFWHRLRYAQKCHKTQVLSSFVCTETTQQIAVTVPHGIPWISGKRQPLAIQINMYVCKYIYILYISEKLSEYMSEILSGDRSGYISVCQDECHGECVIELVRD